MNDVDWFLSNKKERRKERKMRRKMKEKMNMREKAKLTKKDVGIILFGTGVMVTAIVYNLVLKC